MPHKNNDASTQGGGINTRSHLQTHTHTRCLFPPKADTDWAFYVDKIRILVFHVKMLYFYSIERRYPIYLLIYVRNRYIFSTSGFFINHDRSSRCTTGVVDTSGAP